MINHRYAAAVALSIGSLGIVATSAKAQSYSLTAATNGCYQGKCTKGLTNEIGIAPPSTIPNFLTDTTYTNGSNAGLGCSSNGTLVACSYDSLGVGIHYTPVRLFNADGTTVSVNQSPLSDGSASKSAPYVFADGGVLAVDDKYISYTPPAHNIWYYSQWYVNGSTQPFAGSPISPTVVQTTSGSTNSYYAFVATSCNANFPSNPTTGAFLACGAELMPLGANSLETSHGINIGSSAFFGTPQYDAMTVGGVQYSTVNTPGLDTMHNRIYVVAQSVTASSSGTTDNTAAYNGAILAYNVSSSGTLSAPTDIYDFSGPSGSSPVVIPNYTYTDSLNQTHVGTAIFFDGQAKFSSGMPTTALCESASSGSTADGCFFGILDTNPTGATGVTNPTIKMWDQLFVGGIFEAGAALDTSGTPGIWVFPTAPSVYSTPNCPQTGSNPTDVNCLVKLNLDHGVVIQGPVNLTTLTTGATNTLTAKQPISPTTMRHRPRWPLRITDHRPT